MTRPSKPSPAIHYRVEAPDLNTHLFTITLTVTRPAAQQVLTLPVWIPGSYLIREFSKNLQGLTARQGRKKLIATQLDKCTWQIDCTFDAPLEVSYQVYALDNSVRTAWLDSSRGFFNGTSVFLRVEGQEAAAHTLDLIAPRAMANWQVATGLSATKTRKSGFGRYQAANYDELVDSPVEMGAFWSGSFTAGGITHQFVVSGAPPSFDGARLLADTQRICEAQIVFWHGAKPRGRQAAKVMHQRYVFMLNAVDDGYGGLEHRNSTALICNRKDLPRLSGPSLESAGGKQPEGYTTLLGLISHEYFHTWNVKRLRPFEVARYNYQAENHTQLLWFFEGFTSYYDDLILRRAGLIDNAAYLKLLTKTVNQVAQTPGRLVQSVAQASFDAWVKYYRQDENTPNATVSYYTKGSLLALCLDLTLRAEGRTTLDDVMRALWQRCTAGPMTQDDLEAVLALLAKRSFSKELAQWVHGTDELPVKTLLPAHGVSVLEEDSQIAQRLGLRVDETAGIKIKTVLRGGACEQAGFSSGDEWLGIEPASGKDRTGWRLARLEELPLYLARATTVTALLARDKRLLRLPLNIPKDDKTCRLTSADKVKLDQWLGA